MKKLHLSVPRVSKKVLLITAGLLVVLALLGVGMIAQVRAERKADAEVAQAAVAQKAKDDATAKQLATLTAENTALKADKQVLCTNVTSLSQAKATRTLVVIPLAGHCSVQ